MLRSAVASKKSLPWGSRSSRPVVATARALPSGARAVSPTAVFPSPIRRTSWPVATSQTRIRLWSGPFDLSPGNAGPYSSDRAETRALPSGVKASFERCFESASNARIRRPVPTSQRTMGASKKLAARIEPSGENARPSGWALRRWTCDFSSKRRIGRPLTVSYRVVVESVRTAIDRPSGAKAMPWILMPFFSLSSIESRRRPVAASQRSRSPSPSVEARSWPSGL